MIFHKTLVTLMIVSCSIISVSSQAHPSADDYSESYVLTVHSCHFLEFVDAFTNHSFLIQINSSSESADVMFGFNGRFDYSGVSFTLQSTSERYIRIRFEVYDVINDIHYPCDLDQRPGIGSAEVLFDSFTGHWTGDDSIGDESGYGRLNGCDDGSYDSFERDFELCFSICVVDPDGDGIPRWIEENVFFTDPTVNDSSRDDDHDGIPLWWEWRWGYDPLSWDDHQNLDPDYDGLSNYEEYLTSQWGSDPFRKDMFLELDQMEPAPGRPAFVVSNSTIMMVYQTYAKRNIAFHVDDGCMGGGEILPFDPMVWFGEEKRYYREYFLHNDPNNWRRGVFRYALYVHDHRPIRGMEFPGENSILRFFKPGLNSYVIATSAFDTLSCFHHACLMLHELGHTLGIYMGNPLGCDNQLMRNPFSIQKIIFKNYRSVMNYLYCYTILDYSDGTNGFGDYDDWGNIDLTFFQPDGALTSRTSSVWARLRSIDTIPLLRKLFRR